MCIFYKSDEIMKDSIKIAIIVGTRPEIIKMSPIIRILKDKNIDFFIIHSNQHYSKNMDAIFFEELQLPQPQYNLGIGSADHGNQTGQMMSAIEKILLKEKPTLVLAQGDTNTVLAAILTASKQNILTGHIEAGLRSYDRRMPEEKNRVICDVLSDFLFAPTQTQEKILLSEGIDKDKIFVVGNTIVDAVYENKQIAMKTSKILLNLNLSKKKFVLFTAHRSLNVDTKQSLNKIIETIAIIKKKTHLPIIYPMHPRTKVKLEKFDLCIKDALVIDPLGYLDFLCLIMNASLIVTDSGGIQEEACILQVPCITIRENTERPETVDVGANKIVDLDKEKLIQAIHYFSLKKHEWQNPFGNGKTAQQIMEVVLSHLKT